MKKTLRGLGGTKAFAVSVLQKLPPKGEGAIVLALSGDLGVGKTAFVKLVAKELGITERVVSPTFVLERDYRIAKHPRFTRLVHIDAYRLDSEKDLKPLKLEGKFRNPRDLIVIEWAERVRKALPQNSMRLNFRFIDENTREVEAFRGL